MRFFSLRAIKNSTESLPKQINFFWFIPGITWFFIVLVLLCMPGSDIPSTSWIDRFYVDKWVHSAIFGLMALLFMLPFAFSSIVDKEKLHYFIRIAIATSIWGLTTEFIQEYLAYQRSFDLLDWVADSLGVFISFIFCRKKYSN